MSIRFNDGTYFEANPDSEKDFPTEWGGWKNFHFPAQVEWVQLHFQAPELYGFRIIIEHERAPLPAFVNDGDDHGTDDNGDGAELADGVPPKNDEITILNDQASASNVPYHGSQAADKHKLVNN